MKPGHGNESSEFQPLDHEGQWLLARPWLVCFVEMNFNKEMESSKTRKVYRRRKEKKEYL